MKKFAEPSIEIEKLVVEDVITSSTPLCDNESDVDRG